MDAADEWLNPDSDGIWSDDPRASADALLRALLADNVGTVLVGTQEDRRSVIGAVIDRLRAERPVYQLHGSPFVAELKYGALSMLLARAELGPEATWYRVTKVLADFLSPTGADPAVVILSQPQLMDRESITVLAQLAHQRRVTLVVQCDRPLDLPPDLAALARAQDLEQVTVRPLTPAGSRELLAEHLGAPVSRVAATVLWSYSGGHVGRLRSIADDCIGSGKLLQADGHWILAAGPLPGGPGPVGEDLVMRRMTGRRRALLEELASRGSVQVAELVQDGDGGELDELQAQGIVHVRATPAGRLAAVQPMWRDRVRGALEPERRRELDRLAAEHDGPQHVLVQVEQHLAVADVAGVLEVLDQADATAWTEHAEPPDDVQAHLLWVKARALVASGDYSGTQELVEAAARTHDPCLTVLAATVAALRGDLPGARRWLAATGQTQRSAQLDPRSPGRNLESVLLRAEATRGEVLALSDDQDGARRAAAWVATEMSVFRQRGVLDTVMVAHDRASLAVSLLEIYLCCGDLDSARRLAEAILVARHGNANAVLYAELAIAAVELLSGRLDVAGAAAAPLVEQSRALGDPHAMAVAQALDGFCRTALGRDHPRSDAHGADARGTDAVAEARPDVASAWGRLGWFAAVTRSLAVDLSDEDATAGLVALADQARSAGLDVVELHALLGAALRGSSEVAVRLLASARRTQCSLSLPSVELAAALLADDPARSCRALTAIAAAGYLVWHRGGAAPVAANLPPADARRLAEFVARHQAPDQRPEVDETPTWMGQLTPREREIARLVVDGRSNATVARHLYISVRTVEGHLNQIYAKLGVRGRSALIRLSEGSTRLQPVR